MPTRADRERLAAQGRCNNCAKRLPKKGCKWCTVCLSRSRLTEDDRQDERRERGSCPRCGKRRPATGRKRCSICNRKSAESKRRRQSGSPKKLPGPRPKVEQS